MRPGSAKLTEFPKVVAYAQQRADAAILEFVDANPGRLPPDQAADLAAEIAEAGVERFNGWLDQHLDRSRISPTGGWRQAVDAGVRCEASQRLKGSGEGGSPALLLGTPDDPRGGSGGRWRDEAEIGMQGLAIARKLVWKLVPSGGRFGDTLDRDDIANEAVATGVERCQRLWNPKRGPWRPYLAMTIKYSIRDQLRKLGRRGEMLAFDERAFDHPKLHNAEAALFAFAFFAVDTWAKQNLTPACLNAYLAHTAGAPPGDPAERMAWTEACRAIQDHFGPLSDLLAS